MILQLTVLLIFKVFFVHFYFHGDENVFDVYLFIHFSKMIHNNLSRTVTVTVESMITLITNLLFF